MCTNQRLIKSPYMRRPMYVKCGQCPSCQQEKASKRVNRIINSQRDDYTTFLISLTYSQNCAPYILRTDAESLVKHKVSSIPILRDCVVRKVRKPSNFDDYNQVYKVQYNTVELGSIDYVDSSYNSLDGVKDLAKEDGKIGVCYYKDLQHFIARLRINLKRHYNYEKELSIYACSELGCKSLRPHFHIGLSCPKSDKETLRSAVYESWPFSNLRRFPKSVQEAYRSANYLASYVNCDTKFPNFFKVYQRPKHSYSKGFGSSNPSFQLDKILKKIDSGFICYTVLKNIGGIRTSFDVPIPSYVIHRFFPKFKGLSRVDVPEVLSYFDRIRNYDYVTFFSTSRMSCKDGELIEVEHRKIGYLVDDEIKKVWTRLNNAYLRCKSLCPEWFPDFVSYSIYHQRIWSAYNSTLLRFQMEDFIAPLEEHFDNLDDYLDRPNCNFLFRLAGLNPSNIKYTNPNMFQSVRNRTANNENFFYRHIKHRNISNSIYQLNPDCEL